MHRTLVPLLVVLAAVLVGAGCSDDNAPPAAVTTTAGAATATTAGLSAEVQDFCDQTQRVADQLHQAVGDEGAEVGDVTAVVEQANELALQTATLTDAHPDEAAAISRCANELSVTP